MATNYNSLSLGGGIPVHVMNNSNNMTTGGHPTVSTSSSASSSATYPSTARSHQQSLESIVIILDQLDRIAEDRIRDLAGARNLLAGLLRTLSMYQPHSSARSSDDGPVDASLHSSSSSATIFLSLPLSVRIIKRLCYYANARDSTIRSTTFQVIRTIVGGSSELAGIVLKERLVLSLVRSLEREVRYMWERCCALALIRQLLSLAPTATPIAFLRSLLSIASYSGMVTESSSTGSSNNPGNNNPKQAVRNNNNDGILVEPLNNNNNDANVGAYHGEDLITNAIGGNHNPNGTNDEGIPDDPPGYARNRSSNRANGGSTGTGNNNTANPSTNTSTHQTTNSSTNPGNNNNVSTIQNNPNGPDPLRHEALLTIASLSLVPTILPLLSSIGGITLLIETCTELLHSTVPGDASIVPTLFFTFIRLLTNPRSRPYAPASLLLDLIASAWTSLAYESMHTAITAAQRTRWSIARYLLITFSRTWTGLLAIASDIHFLSSLFSPLLQPSSNPQLSLSILRTILELLCPPVAAEIEGLLPLTANGRIPSLKPAVQGVPVSEENGFRQAIAVSFGALSASRQARMMHEKDKYTEHPKRISSSLETSSIEFDINTVSAKHCLVVVDDALVQGMEGPPTMISASLSSKLSSLSRSNVNLQIPNGFAVPIFTTDQRHDVDDEMEFFSNFWLMVGKTVPTKYTVYHQEHLSLSPVVPSMTEYEPFSSSAPLPPQRTIHTPVLRTTGTGTLLSYSLSPFSFVQMYRAHMLTILLQAGIMRAVTCAAMHPNPIVSLAGAALTRYIIKLSLHLLPSPLSDNAWGLADAIQVSTVAFARNSSIPSVPRPIPFSPNFRNANLPLNDVLSIIKATMSSYSYTIVPWGPPDANPLSTKFVCYPAVTVSLPSLSILRKQYLKEIFSKLNTEQKLTEIRSSYPPSLYPSDHYVPRKYRRLSSELPSFDPGTSSSSDFGIRSRSVSASRSTPRKMTPSQRRSVSMEPYRLPRTIEATTSVANRRRGKRNPPLASHLYMPSYSIRVEAVRNISEMRDFLPSIVEQTLWNGPFGTERTVSNKNFQVALSKQAKGKTNETFHALFHETFQRNQHPAAITSHLSFPSKTVVNNTLPFPLLSIATNNSLDMNLAEEREPMNRMSGAYSESSSDPNERFLAGKSYLQPMTRSAYADWHARVQTVIRRRGQIENLRLNGVLADGALDPEDAERAGRTGAFAVPFQHTNEHLWMNHPPHHHRTEQGAILSSPVLQNSPYDPANIGTGLGVRYRNIVDIPTYTGNHPGFYGVFDHGTNYQYHPIATNPRSNPLLPHAPSNHLYGYGVVGGNASESLRTIVSLQSFGNQVPPLAVYHGRGSILYQGTVNDENAYDRRTIPLVRSSRYDTFRNTFASPQAPVNAYGNWDSDRFHYGASKIAAALHQLDRTFGTTETGPVHDALGYPKGNRNPFHRSIASDTLGEALIYIMEQTSHIADQAIRSLGNATDSSNIAKQNNLRIPPSGMLAALQLLDSIPQVHKCVSELDSSRVTLLEKALLYALKNQELRYQWMKTLNKVSYPTIAYEDGGYDRTVTKVDTTDDVTDMYPDWSSNSTDGMNEDHTKDDDELPSTVSETVSVVEDEKVIMVSENTETVNGPAERSDESKNSLVTLPSVPNVNMGIGGMDLNDRSNRVTTATIPSGSNGRSAPPSPPLPSQDAAEAIDAVTASKSLVVVEDWSGSAKDIGTMTKELLSSFKSQPSMKDLNNDKRPPVPPPAPLNRAASARWRVLDGSKPPEVPKNKLSQVSLSVTEIDASTDVTNMRETEERTKELSVTETAKGSYELVPPSDEKSIGDAAKKTTDNLTLDTEEFDERTISTTQYTLTSTENNRTTDLTSPILSTNPENTLFNGANSIENTPLYPIPSPKPFVDDPFVAASRAESISSGNQRNRQGSSVSSTAPLSVVKGRSLSFAPASTVRSSSASADYGTTGERKSFALPPASQRKSVETNRRVSQPSGLAKALSAYDMNRSSNGYTDNGRNGDEDNEPYIVAPDNAYNPSFTQARANYGRMPRSIGIVTHIREEDRAIDWDILRLARGGVKGLVDNHSFSHAYEILTQLQHQRSYRSLTDRYANQAYLYWQRYRSLPVHVPRLRKGNCVILEPSILMFCEFSVEGSAYPSVKDSGTPSVSMLSSVLSDWQRQTGIGNGQGRIGSYNSSVFASASSASVNKNSTVRDNGTSSLVNSAFNCIRLSKVLAAKDWRTWDWNVIALLLDHHLTNPVVLGETIHKTQFMQRLGDVLARISDVFSGTSVALPGNLTTSSNGSGNTMMNTEKNCANDYTVTTNTNSNLSPTSVSPNMSPLLSLPWVPASLRFIRITRQYLLLCLHHPLGRELLRSPRPKTNNSSSNTNTTSGNSNNNATGSGGLAAEIFLAIWSQLSPLLGNLSAQHSMGNNRTATNTIVSGGGLSSRLFSAASFKNKASTSNQGNTNNSLSSSNTIVPNDEQAVAMNWVKDVLGSASFGDAHATVLSRSSFETTLAHELLPLLGLFLGTEEGLRILSTIKASVFYDLQDAPNAMVLVGLLRDLGVCIDGSVEDDDRLKNGGNTGTTKTAASENSNNFIAASVSKTFATLRRSNSTVVGRGNRSNRKLDIDHETLSQRSMGVFQDKDNPEIDLIQHDKDTISRAERISSSILMIANDPLLSLLTLGSNPGTEYLARSLLGCFDYSRGGTPLLILRAWCYRNPSNILMDTYPKSMDTHSVTVGNEGSFERKRTTSSNARAAYIASVVTSTNSNSDMVTDSGIIKNDSTVLSSANRNSSTLTSPFTVSQSMALYSTNYLRVLLRKNVPGYADWGIDILIYQLRNKDKQIMECALLILIEAASVSRIYRLSIIQKRPPLDHLPWSNVAPLVTLLLDEPAGFRYISRFDNILDKLLNDWLRIGHVQWMITVDDCFIQSMEYNGALLDDNGTVSQEWNGSTKTLSSSLLATFNRYRTSDRYAHFLLPHLKNLSPSIWNHAQSYNIGSSMAYDIIDPKIKVVPQKQLPPKSVPISSSPVKVSTETVPLSTVSASASVSLKQSLLSSSAILGNASIAPARPASTSLRRYVLKANLAESLQKDFLLTGTGNLPAPDSPPSRGISENFATNSTTASTNPPKVSSSSVRQDSPPSTNAPSKHDEPWPIPLNIPLPTDNWTNDGKPMDDNQHPWRTAHPPLETLLQLPWRIEVWAEWDRNLHNRMSTNTSNDNQTNNSILESEGSNQEFPSSASLGLGSYGSGNMSGTPGENGSTHSTLPTHRDIVRQDILCDTLVDFSCMGKRDTVMQMFQSESQQRPSASSSCPVPCDGYFRATCIGSNGRPQPVVVPPQATIHAALFCGAHAVSSLGDFPITALFNKSNAPTSPPLNGTNDPSSGSSGSSTRSSNRSSSRSPADVSIHPYRDLDMMLRSMGSTSYTNSQSNPSSTNGAASLSSSLSNNLRRAVPYDSVNRNDGNTSRRSTSVSPGRSNGYRNNNTNANLSGRPSPMNNYFATNDDRSNIFMNRRTSDFGGNEGYDDDVAERTNVTTTGGRNSMLRSRASSLNPRGSSIESNFSAAYSHSSHTSNPGSSSSTSVSTVYGSTDDHQNLDDTLQKLRQRHNHTVASINIPPRKRNVYGWIAECGLLELESITTKTNGSNGNSGTGMGIDQSPGEALAACLLSTTTPSSASTVPNTNNTLSGLPDYAISGPEANTGVLTPSILTSRPPGQVAGLLRASADRYAQWNVCDTATITNTDTEVQDTVNDVSESNDMNTDNGNVDQGSIPSLFGTKSSNNLFTHCPPGSTARFTFSTQTDNPSTLLLSLHTVEFGFVLLPKQYALQSIGLNIYRQLAQHSMGIRYLARKGHIRALLQVSFGKYSVTTERQGPNGNASFGTGYVLEAIMHDQRMNKNGSCPTAVLQRRAALWALGHIGSSEQGIRTILHTCPEFFLRMDALSRGFRLIHVSTLNPNVRENPVHIQRDFVAVPEPEDDTALRMTSMQVMNILANHQELSANMFTILGWSCIPQTCTASSILVPQVPVTAYTVLSRPSAVFDNDDPYNFAATLSSPSVSSSSNTVTNRRIDDVQVTVPSSTADASTDTPCIVYPIPFLHSSLLPTLPIMTIPVTNSVYSTVVPVSSTSTNLYDIILQRIAELASRITQKEARTALLKIKNEKPDAFASSALYAHVHAILSRYNLSLPVRRFIHNLFDRVSFSDRAWTW